MTTQAFGWRFEQPAWFLLVLLLVALAWIVRRRRPAVAFAGAPLLRGGPPGLPPMPKSLRQRLAGLPWLFEVLAMAAIVAALARPVQRLPLPPERQGIDVLLCLDTSSSMAATDLGDGRTRHAVAIEVAAAFVAQRRDDRTGFLTFARYADLRCPPTLDHETAAELLRGVAMVGKESPEDATGIGGALALAATVLGRSQSPTKVIVLLTDGEENVATSATPAEIAPLHAGQLCAQFGIRVHGIVVGQGNQKPDGRYVPLDTTAVRQVAETTGGRFFVARDATALAQVYRDIDALEKVAFAEPRVLVREWFPAFGGLAVLLLAAGGLGRRRFVEVLP
jgi:Ca-activated chloride channel family protein